jgi:hypothetical protein
MATTNDNSNLTPEEILEAQNKKRQLKTEKTQLEADLRTLKEYLERNKSSAFPPMGGTQSPGSIALLADWQAIPNDGNGKAIKPPITYTFNAAELSAWQTNTSGTYGGNSPKSVLVQAYAVKYGQSYLPSFFLGNRSFYNSVTVAGAQQNGKNHFILNEYQKAYWEKQNQYNTKNARLRYVTVKIKYYQSLIDEAPEINLISPDGTLSQNKFIGLVYNVGSVQEAYLSSRTDFLTALTAVGKANTPHAITNASQLWVDGHSNKGMIQPYTQNQEQNSLPVEVALPSASDKYNAKTKAFNPTGFQFLYNPASVNMVYSGMLGVDPNMQTNGLDQFNPLGVYTQSTVDFNILINRMFDFKYYDKKTGVIADEYKSQTTLYYPRQPEIDEQKDIYKKGTMYDVEHLLRAVLGFGMSSFLGRNMSDGMTADLGFITGIPVELHLGSNMRYLGNVTQLNVSHVLFDERMVPIFTNLSISFARLIDPVGQYVTSKTTYGYGR